MSLAARISWCSLLALIFIVPIAISNMTFLNNYGFRFDIPITYDQFDIVKVFFQRVLGGIALAAWLWDVLSRGGKIRRTPVEWLILAFLGWVTVSTVLSISPATAFFGKYRRFEGLASFINYAVIYFLVLQFADRPSRIRTIARTLFFSSIVVAGYGVLQSLTPDARSATFLADALKMLGGAAPLALLSYYRFREDDARQGLYFAGGGTVAALTMIGLAYAKTTTGNTSLLDVGLLVAFVAAGVALVFGFLGLAEEHRLKFTGWALAATGLVSFAGVFVGKQIAQSARMGLSYVSLDGIPWGKLPFEVSRAFSTYGNPDLLGGFLMFSVPIALALILSESRTAWRSVYWVGLLINTWCLVVAFTRGAWIGAIVGFVVMLVVSIRQRAQVRGEDFVFGGATAAVALAVVLKSLSNPNEVMNFSKRFASIFETGTGSGQTRLQIWDAAWRATKARPFFGWGADTFRLVFPQYKPVEYVKAAGYLSVADNVHDYPLQLMAGIGIPGAAMLYGIFGWVAVRSGKVVFKAGRDLNRVLLGGFWAACAAYIMELMTGLSVTGSTFLLWVAMGVLVAPTARVVTVKKPAWGTYARWVGAALAAALIVFMTVQMSADRSYLIARTILPAKGAQVTAADYQTRVEQTLRAVKLNPYNDMYRAEVGLAYTDEVFYNVNMALTAPQQNIDPAPYYQSAAANFTLAEKYLKDTIAFVPDEYDNYVFIVNLYNIGGQLLATQFPQRNFPQDAVDWARKGIKVEQYGPAIRYQLARALLTLKKTDEAVGELEYAVKMDPAYTEAALLLAQSYTDAGRFDDVVKMLDIVEANDPGQSGVAETLSNAHYELALRAQKAGDAAKVTSELEAALKSYAGNADAAIAMSRILVAEGRRTEALQLLQSAKAVVSQPKQTLLDEIAKLEATATLPATKTP